MMSSLYLIDNYPDLFEKWIVKTLGQLREFLENRLFLYSRFWFDIINEISKYDVVRHNIFIQHMTTDF